MPGLHKRWLTACALVASLTVVICPVQAQEADWKSRSVRDVLDQLRSDGLALVYSTQLVSDDLVVESEPLFRDPVLLLEEILEPHGLTLLEQDGVYLVVRRQAPVDPAPQTAAEADSSDDPALALENITVSASRYILFSNSQFFIDQRAVRALPDLGEDPIRSVQRLPGAAAGGLSARTHFRGGEHNETAIYLNGLKLLDPFHIRDYHAIFSSVDARAVAGVEAYSGGFPAAYGDQMSGVLALDTARAEEPLHTELGLSIYNTSLLNSGFTSAGAVDWLISARDSNLDVVLSDDLGKPDYFDVFGELGFNFREGHRLAFNILYADDQVVVTTESEAEELEQSVSDTLNRHFWVTLDDQWSPDLSSRTVLAYAGLENERDVEVNDPERMIGSVVDRRKAEIYSLEQAWRYSGLANHRLSWGLSLRQESARYNYWSQAAYRGLYEFYPGIENPTVIRVQAKPEGSSQTLWLSDRWQLTEQTRMELGVRWDRQGYTAPGHEAQFSPRASLLHAFGDRTELRLTWGRYQQSQAIHEMQVEDGIDHFFVPQRSDHYIAGIQHRFSGPYRLRLEAYVKDYGRLKPRFENLFNPLAMIPERAPDRVALLPASARAAGIETTVESRGGGELDWWITYSFSRATDRIDGVNQLRSWDQRHSLQAGLAWQRGPWEVGVALKVHTGWPTTAMELATLPAGDEDDDIYLPVPGPRNSERFAPFAQLDFRISREFAVKIGRLSAFFEVTNATNRKNACCVDYDLDEDEAGNIYLDRSLDHWLPIIPAIGVFWEF